LLTNNPEKAEDLRRASITVSDTKKLAISSERNGKKLKADD
jgi:hypothetical protein